MLRKNNYKFNASLPFVVALFDFVRFQFLHSNKNNFEVIFLLQRYSTSLLVGGISHSQSLKLFSFFSGTSLLLVNHIRVIPQGTVDNNLGPDRLAGTKALDPNYCRHPTLWLHDLCLEVITVHGIELRLFWAKAYPYSYY